MPGALRGKYRVTNGDPLGDAFDPYRGGVSPQYLHSETKDRHLETIQFSFLTLKKKKSLRGFPFPDTKRSSPFLVQERSDE